MKSFYEKVYEIVESIPRGKVTSYGQIARMLGSPRAARVVGYALHQNPRPGVTPCHRVVNREGRLAPGFAFGGLDEQRHLLEAEGVRVENGYVDTKVYGWNGSAEEIEKKDALV
ncbi:MAG: MGMT family protein [Christensenellaceae bacterium]